MSRRLLLIECVERRRLPSLHWALLAASLEDLPHDRILVHRFALPNLVQPTALEGRVLVELPALVFLDTSFPVREARAFVRSLAPTPVVYYGAYALDRFEQVPVRAAMIGPSRAELRALGELALRGDAHPTEAEFRSVERMALRTPAPDGERWEFHSGGGRPDAEAVLLPFTPSFDWEYFGPRRREDSDVPHRARLWWPSRISGAASAEERGTGGVAATPPSDVPSPLPFDPRWDVAAIDPLSALLEEDPEAALFDLETASRAEAVSCLVDQARFLIRAGHRSLVVPSVDPTPHLLPWLRELGRSEDRPAEVLLSPSIHVLRRSDGIRQELLGAAQLTDRLALTGIAFGGFDDQSLRMRGLRETHWDQRWVARLLTDLDGAFDGRVLTTADHELSLLDPWTDPHELLESLVAIEEDAPFLKPQVHPGSRLAIRTRYGRLGRRIGEAGLLRSGETESGWEYSCRDSRMPTFLGVAQQGLGPLVEGIGRLRLSPRARHEAIIEARFRWMRQLAEQFESDADTGAASWGKVLANVTREVAIDLKRG